jgi:hypothetical protein
MAELTAVFWSHSSRLNGPALLATLWHPLAAKVAKSQDHADLFLTRLTVAW